MPSEAAAYRCEMGKIYVGTCNWADFKDWYPSGLKPGERLRYYATQFSVVEIDSTFHTLMPRRNFESWASNTPDEFVFDVKAYRTLTRHGSSYEPGRRHSDAEPSDDPPDEDFAKFRYQIEPLRECGKLRAIQFQFPPWFARTPSSVEHIEVCREYFLDYLIAVEFRNRTWLEPEFADETFSFLRKLNITYTIADEPQVGTGTVPPTVAVTNPDLAVIRFHGRNAQKWYARGGESSRDRYDYLYGEEELGAWVPVIIDLAEQTQEVHILMNNNVAGQGLVNGKQFQQLLKPYVVMPSDDQGEVQTEMQFG
ncbi:MAG: hypothetical protein JWO42_2804 [Chloroflexi bacterium]|nr:hypothetical protein [Chloroflexota bacterium]